MKGGAICNIFDTLYPSDKMQGGKLKIGRAIKKAFSKKNMKKIATGLGDAAQNIKKVVPRQMIKDIASAGIAAATTAMGRPDLANVANEYVNRGVNAGYETNLRKGSVGKNLLAALKSKGPMPSFDALPVAEVVSGAGKRKRYTKGSQEAKDFMASLRASRGANPGPNVRPAKRRQTTRTPTGAQAVMAIDQMSGNMLPRQIGSVRGKGFLPF